MANPENIKELKKLIEEILERMSFSDFNLDVREETDANGESLVFNVVTKEADLLIGQYGANLRALQHIIRAMARRRVEEKIHFSVDVNDYRREKVGSLEELARAMARQASDEKRAIVLRPMSAYERRIIHLTLSQDEKVKTESLGEGEERKVVIKPMGEVEAD